MAEDRERAIRPALRWARRSARCALAAGLLVAAACSGSETTKSPRDEPASASGPTSTTTTEPVALAPTPGAADLGDEITPGAGNGGYDVTRYDLDIEVATDRNSIEAEATVTATATQDLSTFNLDLAPLDVLEVAVASGAATRSDDQDLPTATFTHEANELVVTPGRPIADGESFVTVVTYRGSPEPVADPSAPGTIGWLSAPSGTFVAAETTGAKSFMPVNDHPSDKARFSFTITAASTDTVVANGTLTSKEEVAGDRTRWTFDQTDPMATYLIQIAVGDYEMFESTGPRGLPIRHAVVRSITPEQRAVLDDTVPQLEFFESLFGPYPLDNYGVLIADAAPDFALETQTLTLMPAAWFGEVPAATSAILAHELAHQWFGNAVSPANWSDIWLNEGFATYSEWLWNDHREIIPVDLAARNALEQAAAWRDAFGPVTDPNPAVLFSPNQYEGAGIVLHALRLTLGDEPFFEILRTWAEEGDGASATTADFEALTARIAGRDLTSFFDEWLRSATVPAFPA